MGGFAGGGGQGGYGFSGFQPNVSPTNFARTAVMPGGLLSQVEGALGRGGENGYNPYGLLSPQQVATMSPEDQLRTRLGALFSSFMPQQQIAQAPAPTLTPMQTAMAKRVPRYG